LTIGYNIVLFKAYVNLSFCENDTVYDTQTSKYTSVQHVGSSSKLTFCVTSFDRTSNSFDCQNW